MTANNTTPEVRVSGIGFNNRVGGFANVLIGDKEYDAQQVARVFLAAATPEPITPEGGVVDARLRGLIAELDQPGSKSREQNRHIIGELRSILALAASATPQRGDAVARIVRHGGKDGPVHFTMEHACYDLPNGTLLYTTPQRTDPPCPECSAPLLYECVACSANNYPPKERTDPPAEGREDLQAEIHKIVRKYLTKPQQGHFMGEVRAMLAARPQPEDRK